jgi:hypothetical protein
MNIECEGITCAPPLPPPHSVPGCEERFFTRDEMEETPSSLGVAEAGDALGKKSNG